MGWEFPFATAGLFTFAIGSRRAAVDLYRLRCKK